jgi:hypothetical protein
MPRLSRNSVHLWYELYSDRHATILEFSKSSEQRGFEGGRSRDWMASVLVPGMKVQSDSQRKLSQIA